jgi:hypothetical protein
MMVSMSINSALTPHFIFEDVATVLMNIESMGGRNQFMGRERRLCMIKKHQLRNGKNYVGKKLLGTQYVAALDDGQELAAGSAGDLTGEERNECGEGNFGRLYILLCSSQTHRCKESDAC